MYKKYHFRKLKLNFYFSKNYVNFPKNIKKSWSVPPGFIRISALHAHLEQQNLYLE